AAGGAREGEGLVVADHPGGDLHQAFAHDGVYLARHDRRSRLPVGQYDLVETAARAAPQPANVVGNGKESDGNGSELAAAFDQAVPTRVGFEVVLGFNKRDAGIARQILGYLGPEARMGIDAAAHCRTAGRQLSNRLLRTASPFKCQVQLPYIAAELLAEVDRRCIRKMRAANLDNVVPGAGFFSQDVT